VANVEIASMAYLLADIYSMALTTVSSLLRKYEIDPASIGRLEVGTETLLDKSKSVKTILMQLFEPCGNTNVEGVDTVNACYGGTNAFFNTVNWLESSAWDGRDAIVVAGDIALYKKGAARPTGGAGCVAILLGPDAPVVVEPGLRSTYIKHAYDFYKPDLTSEYPIVDGHYSLKCYTEALEQCYSGYHKREAQLKKQQMAQGMTNGVHAEPETTLDKFDHMCFHSPTCKTVAKSYSRLLYCDYREDTGNPMFEPVPAEIKDMPYEQSISDKSVEKAFAALAKKRYTARVLPSMQVATMCGNMYCASVYSSLVSLLCNISSEDMQGKRIGMFSYGSGLAASMFSLKVKGSTEEIRRKVDLQRRLDDRRTVAPEVYDKMCNLRERAHLKNDYTPKGDAATIAPGTYYLTEVDKMFRRSYEIKQ